MKQLGSFMTSVYREESKSLCAHTEAMCKASPQFLPIVLDKTGWRGGKEYRYASIHSIRRSTQPALSAFGLKLSHIYGHSDEGEHVTTVLRHVSGEWEASTLKVPFRADAQEQKSIRTGLCRTATEGLLAIICEDDDDSAFVVEADNERAELTAAQSHSLDMAGRAIAAAPNAAALDNYITLAAQRVAEGALAAESMGEINQRVFIRRAQLEAMNDRDTTALGNENADAVGSSGSGASGKPRGAVKSGRGDLPAGDQRTAATT